MGLELIFRIQTEKNFLQETNTYPYECFMLLLLMYLQNKNAANLLHSSFFPISHYTPYYETRYTAEL